MTDIVSADDSVLKPTDIEVVKADAVPAVDAFAASNDFSRVQPRQIVGGVSRGIQQLGGPTLYADSGAQQIVAAPDNIPQVVMGKQATFGEGFYVSKPGVDATLNTDPSQWIFNSNQNVFKIVKTDVITAEFVPALVSTISIEHHLDFAPIPQAFLINVGVYPPVLNGNLQLPTFIGASLGGAVADVVTFSSYMYAAADDTYVHFQFFDATSLGFGPVNIRYYLLQESSGLSQ